jgi:hypothetical protein
MRMSGCEIPVYLMLLARAVDELATIRWFMSTDGAAGRNRPRRLVPLLLGQDDGEGSNDMNPSVDSPQELMEILKSYG